jgi:hypothetical protein
MTLTKVTLVDKRLELARLEAGRRSTTGGRHRAVSRIVGVMELLESRALAAGTLPPMPG